MAGGIQHWPKKKVLNKKVLVTAGPTYEAIDPVRFIGNHSSGRMGYAIADAFALAGAEVTLVSGPTSFKPTHPGVNLVNVTSAAEMFDACSRVIGQMDIAIFAAAVADFTPDEKTETKIKREKDDLVIRLKPTKDIAGELGKKKKAGQFFVGFALETDHGIEHAQVKLERKNLDFIVLNSLEDEGAGFGTETNKVTMIDKSGGINKFELKHKSEVAKDIVRMTEKLIKDA